MLQLSKTKLGDVALDRCNPAALLKPIYISGCQRGCSPGLQLQGRHGNVGYFDHRRQLIFVPSMVDASVPVGLPSISLFRALVDSLTQSVRLPRELGSHVYGGEREKIECGPGHA